METYYYIGGDDVAGILPKKLKRYDSLEEATRDLKQLIHGNTITRVKEKKWFQEDGLPVVAIYYEMSDGVFCRDYEYWIRKRTVQPVYVVMEKDSGSGNQEIVAMFYRKELAQSCLDDLPLINGRNVTKRYWIERHEVEIYD